MVILGKKGPKFLVISDWPVYMWSVSSIYLSLSFWACVKVQSDNAIWWRVVIAMAFIFMLIICLYLSKYQKLQLVATDEDDCFLNENRAFIFKAFHKFSVSQVVNVKMKESGKSSKCYSLEINLVDGRHFSLFDSGIKEKTLKRQFMIRRFIEEYFEGKIPKG